MHANEKQKLIKKEPEYHKIKLKDSLKTNSNLLKVPWPDNLNFEYNKDLDK